MVDNNYTKVALSWLLRLEGLIVLIGSLYVYHQIGTGSWVLFFFLFFIPDIGLVGYFWGIKLGAITYNCTHTYVAPLFLFLFCRCFFSVDLDYLSIIWVAHIGFDRALGFGLKYTTGFKYTHLGVIGKIKHKTILESED